MKTKAAFIRKVGGPEVIEWGDIDLPELGPEDVLVKVEAVAVSHVDTYVRAGNVQYRNMKFPFIIGRDLVGLVEKIGPKVSGFKKGQKVWCNHAGEDGSQGATAEYVIVPAQFLYPAAPGVDSLQLVASANAGAIACRGIIYAAELKPNEILFVNGAAGNVGSAMIQMATLRGAQVLAATSDPDKIKWCQSLGAKLVLDYRTDNLVQEIQKVAPNGVKAFFDTSRQYHFDLATQILQTGGRMIICSGGNEPAPFSLKPFFRNESKLIGFTLFHTTQEELSGYAEIINRCFAENKFKSKIALVMNLSEAAKAHALLTSNPNLWGKIVLKAD